MSRASLHNAPRVLAAAIALTTVLSCNENLPSGPDAFAARLDIVVPRDTLVVGDSNKAQARAVDASGHAVSGLTFTWTTANAAVLGLGTADDATGQNRTFVGIKPGVSVVTLALADKRFTTTNATRNQTVVVGGVRVLSTRDSTLTSINDTARAIATSLVRSNGALVNRASQGIRWIHLGTRTTVVGTGDTIRYIAKSNGVDTLIATHDLCLKSAKCADTVIARVSQVLTMTLSTHTLNAWSFADTLAPAVTLVDRRGNGLAGTSVRFVPLTAADSAIVKVAPPVTVSNPTTGVMAPPQLVSIGNGTAHVLVMAIAPDGATVIASDNITEIVRQVARRVAVEPQRATVSVIDSIPYKVVARDARGAVIADASVGVLTSTNPFNAVWIGPNPASTPTSTATLTPGVSGVALPENNPGAPQVPVIVLPSIVSLIGADTVTAGTTARSVSVTLLDSLGNIAPNTLVRFAASKGASPGSVLSDGSGVATVTWTPPDSAGSYTLTGIRGTTIPSTLADSAGLIVIRRSVVVVAGLPDATKSSVSVVATTIAANGTTTVTVNVKDAFNNPVKTATGAAFTLSATRGTIGAVTCSAGVCTATYTAPATAGADAISAKIGTTDILNSPLALTITP